MNSIRGGKLYTEEDLNSAYNAGYEDGETSKKNKDASAWKDSVKRKIASLSWVYDDPTGQDAEEFLEPVYRELVAARDYELKIKNPERYAELQAMGQLR